MNSETISKQPKWTEHQDPVQASVQFVIQWLAYLYPNCAPNVNDAILRTQTFVDNELNTYWQQFLEEEPLETHLNVLAWVSEQISRKQIPYLIDASWHLLLNKHQFPTLVPSAMRILEAIFSISESELIRIGQKVRAELHNDMHSGVFQLESAKPDYIYYLEQKLLQDSKLIHKMVQGTYTDKSLALSFSAGLIVGAALLWSYQFYTTPDDSTALLAAAIEQSSSLVVDQEVWPDLTNTNEPVVVQPEVKVVEPPAPKPVPIKKEFEPRMMRVTATILNLRVGPESDSEVIIRLGKGAKVWQVGISPSKRWAKVEVNGEVGYLGIAFIVRDK